MKNKIIFAVFTVISLALLVLFVVTFRLYDSNKDLLNEIQSKHLEHEYNKVEEVAAAPTPKPKQQMTPEERKHVNKMKLLDDEEEYNHEGFHVFFIDYLKNLDYDFGLAESPEVRAFLIEESRERFYAYRFAMLDWEVEIETEAYRQILSIFLEKLHHKEQIMEEILQHVESIHPYDFANRRDIKEMDSHFKARVAAIEESLQ